MDDETYFTLKNDKIPNNLFYYATCSGDVSVKKEPLHIENLKKAHDVDCHFTKR